MAEDLALEPQLKESLVKTNMIGNPGDDSGIPVEQMRAFYAAAFAQSSSKIAVKHVTDKTISGLDCNQIHIRIYQPADAVSRKHGLPILQTNHRQLHRQQHSHMPNHDTNEKCDMSEEAQITTETDAQT
ncbi:TPA: hypothetical protein ACH3X2_003185 [Trebouxia sp. C0005]